MSEEEESGKKSSPPLKQFERNNYFFGKLMTVRDAQAEQDYFNEKRHTLNRLISGVGLVYGLKLNKVTRNAVEGWDADVDPGLALDCCGREIVVCSSTTPKKIKEVLVDVDKESFFGLYIKRVDCEKDLTVSIANKSKCEDVCCANRIKENYELILDKEPDLEELSRDINLGSTGNQLSNIYYSEYLESYLESEDIEPRVLMAVLKKKVTGETVTLIPNIEKTHKVRKIVYNNPMLFELFNAHLKDKTNPHEVTAKQVRALETVEGVGNTNKDIHVSNVDFDSRDGTIQISGDQTQNKVYFNLAPEAIRNAMTSTKSFGKINGNEIVISEAINHNAYTNKGNPPPSICLGLVGDRGTVSFMEDLGLMKAVYNLNLLASRQTTSTRVGTATADLAMDVLDARAVSTLATIALDSKLISDSFVGPIRGSLEPMEEPIKEDVEKIPGIFRDPHINLFFKAIYINEKTFKILLINTGSTSVDNVLIRWWATPAREIPEFKINTPVLVKDEPLKVGISIPEGAKISRMRVNIDGTVKTVSPTIESTPEETKFELIAVEELSGKAKNEIKIPNVDKIITIEIDVRKDGVSHVLKKDILIKSNQ